MSKKAIYISVLLGLTGAGVLFWLNRNRIGLFFDDITTKRNIASLHPKIQGDALAFVNKAYKQLGMKLKATSGYRTAKEQEQLYRDYLAGGFRAAPPWQSFHNFGLAFDVVEISPQYGFSKGYPEERWDKIGELGESLGFKWGKSFGDRPHFEKSFGMSTSELYAIVQEGKVNKEGLPKLGIA